MSNPDIDFLKDLLSQPEPKRGGGGRKPKDPTEPRVYDTWWKQPTRLGDCSNPDCPDERPHRVEEGNTMVADVHGAAICRYCFLDGYDPALVNDAS